MPSNRKLAWSTSPSQSPPPSSFQYTPASTTLSQSTPENSTRTPSRKEALHSRLVFNGASTSLTHSDRSTTRGYRKHVRQPPQPHPSTPRFLSTYHPATAPAVNFPIPISPIVSNQQPNQNPNHHRSPLPSAPLHTRSVSSSYSYRRCGSSPLSSCPFHQPCKF